MQKRIIIIAGVGFFAFIVIVSIVYFLIQPKTANITSLQQTLTQSASLTCSYTFDGNQSKFYIKNGSFRIDIPEQTNGSAGTILVTGQEMYIWTGKTGEKTNFAEFIQQEGATVTVDQIKQKILSNYEQYKDSCVSSELQDSLFIPPSDVSFSSPSTNQNQ